MLYHLISHPFSTHSVLVLVLVLIVILTSDRAPTHSFRSAPIIVRPHSLPQHLSLFNSSRPHPALRSNSSQPAIITASQHQHPPHPAAMSAPSFLWKVQNMLDILLHTPMLPPPPGPPTVELASMSPSSPSSPSLASPSGNGKPYAVYAPPSPVSTVSGSGSESDRSAGSSFELDVERAPAVREMVSACRSAAAAKRSCGEETAW